MSISRNALASVLQVVFSGAVLFLLYYHVARVLGTESIGLWAVVLSGAGTARLADLGLGQGLVRFVAHDAELGHLSETKGLLVFGLIATAVSAGVVVVLFWFASDFFLSFAMERPADLEAATSLVPIASISVWTASVSTLVLSVLDGLGRIDVRSIVMIVASVAQLLVTWLTLPEFGVVALGLGHLAQSLVLGGGAILVVLSRVRSWGGSWIPAIKRAKPLLHYGASIQAAGLAQLLVDPAARLLLTRYGGLELTGLFDMAARLVVQARGAIVAGYQAVIPLVARESARANGDAVRQIYLRSLTLLVAFGLPCFGVMLAFLPGVSYVWLGEINSAFTLFGFLSVLSWAANALMVPAYYTFLGTGRTSSLVASQVTTALGTVLLGSLFGHFAGGYGVALGCAFSMLLGSAIVIRACHRHYGIAFSSGRTLGAWPVLVFCLLNGLFCFVASYPAAGVAPEFLIVFPLAFGLLFLAGSFLFHRDLVRRMLASRLTV